MGPHRLPPDRPRWLLPAADRPGLIAAGLRTTCPEPNASYFRPTRRDCGEAGSRGGRKLVAHTAQSARTPPPLLVIPTKTVFGSEA
jgi:hypothetical protein